MMKYKYFENVNTPRDLDKLNINEKTELCGEIRDFIIEKVRKNGGHLASNLGAVEFTVAIHSVFDCPNDHIIFDVGHQAYTHKILTERAERFDSLRKRGGLSGFTKREESVYDCFGAGHSSTSLSAGLGFAQADKLKNSENYTVIVLGDGAYTGGMIHEALNNLDKDLRLVIVLNENEMSISKNTGHFAELISKIRSKKGYYNTKRKTATFIKKIPFIGNGVFGFVKKVKKNIKNSVYGSNYFEDMGLYYLGPCDGNDLSSTINLLNEAKNYKKSCIVHLKTKKGLGYPEAESNPSIYHSVSPENSVKTENFSKRCGSCLSRLADSDADICAITAAMADGTGLSEFEKNHKDRFFDVGIAEEHALTFCAGLAANGLKPYFAVYSSFLQRGFDNIIHDIALQKLGVRILIDRAGISPSDGPTHAGIFDVPFLSFVPGFTLYTPSCFESLEEALRQSVNINTPCAIRYPNDCDIPEIKNGFKSIDGIIKTDITDFSKTDKIIITYGRIVKEAIKAEQKLENCGIILVERLMPYKPLCDLLSSLIDKNASVVFLEESIKINGAGAIVSSTLQNRNFSVVAIDGVFDTVLNTGNYLSDYGIACDDVIKEFNRFG